MVMVMVVTVALGTSILSVLGVSAWSLARLIKREADLLHQLATDQSHRLASVHAELHHARAEVTRVHSDVVVLKRELDSFVHGPPSMRSPQPQAC